MRSNDDRRIWSELVEVCWKSGVVLAAALIIATIAHTRVRSIETGAIAIGLIAAWFNVQALWSMWIERDRRPTSRK